ncbi:MAG: Phosphatidylglycerol lysyltransferase [Gemmatimonadaceae bacterium]|nr:Phosphatidylglycerol lysyltransferase [Gemmatimonadaceae bacterium]
MRWLAPAAALLIAAIAVAILHREMRSFSYHEVLGRVRAIPPSRVLSAIVLTGLVYCVLPCYDLLALRYVQRPVSFLRIGFASAVSYALSQTLGLAALTGGAVRYRFWSAWGLSAPDITRAMAFIGVTFTVGMLTVLGVVGLTEAGDLAPMLHVPKGVVLMLAGMFFATAAGYVAWCARHSGRDVRIRDISASVPPVRLAVGQTLVPLVDWTLAGAVLFALFDLHPGPGFLQFLAVFVAAQLIGLASHVPGGLGVFEGAMLVLLRPFAPPDVILGTLVAYRAVYYLMPFTLGVATLVAHEAWRSRHRVQSTLDVVGRWMPTVLPDAMGMATFAAGAILLVSGATPSIRSRVAFLDRVLPLGMIEASHFVASLAGAALVVLGWALRRRLDAGYGLTVGLLSIGIASSLLKGLDWEEALALSVVLAMLVGARGAFTRKTALLAEPLEPDWIVAVIAVVGASVGLGAFAYRHVEYRADLWWEFTRHGDASRFLRASVGVAGVLFVFGLARLLRHARAVPALPTTAELELARNIACASRDTTANLALMRDKALLFSRTGRSMLMYAVESRSWIALGSPVGDPAERVELIWRFREMADSYGAWPVFYQVTAESLPMYIDLGLTFLKLGEEAVVPLSTFTLDGSDRKGLRRTQREMSRQDVRFDLVPVEGVASILAELRAVSDQWLASKRVREKGFSLGRFDERYLQLFPVAVARRQGRIVAFANVWLGGAGSELSIDLMRYSDDAPHGVMEFVFIELMSWGRSAGYLEFALGMAPMAGMPEHALAPLWNKAGAFLFRHGEHFYNFQGLRQYKEKFDPVWRPRYLASPGGLALPRILGNVATLISGGVRGLVAR